MESLIFARSGDRGHTLAGGGRERLAGQGGCEDERGGRENHGWQGSDVCPSIRYDPRVPVRVEG